MTDRRRNLAILGLVVLLLAASGFIIATKSTKLGLDLRGGIELVYEGKPTPKVPKVTPQAINDALETIRKRTDALGVSEPEIQRAGENQISIGLPDVTNAQRAVQQVGTTAQLQFYDWEDNLLPKSRGGNPFTGSTALYDAATVAAKQKPRAEATDIPVTGAQGHSKEYWDRKNDTAGAKYYLFGPDKKLAQGPDESCKELLSDYDAEPGSSPHKFAKGTDCESELKALGAGGPRDGSKVIKVPQGIVIVEDEPVPGQPSSIHRYYILEDDSELSGDQVKNPEQNFDQNQQPIVTMDFTDTGRKAFARVTKRIADRGSKVILPPGSAKDAGLQHFAITLDDQIVSLATIDFHQYPEGLDGRGGVQIEGVGNVNQAQDLAENLRIGALPIRLDLISQTQVSATLGQQALHQGLIAGLVGLALTILFLLIFYRVLGVVATVALLIYAVLLFALVKLIPITLTLPGIAGLVLTLAVAADANIVMYERIKEEVRHGRSIPAGIAAGYSKALRTIIDANVVTIGVAFILFVIATAGVKGFAFTLGVGTLVSLFTAVLATSAILGSMARSRLLARPSALGAGKERVHWTFDFMGKSRWFFSFSGVILVIGALAIAGKGLNFGIDFESGTRITAPLQREASVDQVRNVLTPLGYGDAKIQAVDDPALGKHVVQISTGTLRPTQVTKVQGALNDKFGVNTGDFSTSSIGPTFGETVAKTAAIAIIASLLLISIYIGLRFEFKFAVPVLIALAHDLLITSGVYALVGREVTTSTVAALLTILGYSLYDTVIVFDRIRENVPRMPRATFSQIANRAMSEVLTRSLATSFAVLMPVGSLLVFGGDTLKDFAFALLIGVASGAYSSIFIATPVLVEWKEREHVYMRRRKLVMEQNDGIVPAFATAAPRGGRMAAEDGDGAAERPDRAARGATRAQRRRAGLRGSAPPRSGEAPRAEAPTEAGTPPRGQTPGQPREPAAPPRTDAPPREPARGDAAPPRADGPPAPPPHTDAPGAADADAPQPGPARPPSRSTSTTSSTRRATRTVQKDGDSGNGADGSPKPPPKPKPKSRNRGRKKHGRR